MSTPGSGALDGGWNVLFLHEGFSPQNLAQLRALHFRGRSLDILLAQSVDAARALIHETARIGVVVAPSASALACARMLREAEDNWETSLVVFDAGRLDPEQIEALLAYNVLLVTGDLTTGADSLARNLLIALASFERRIATRTIARLSSGLLSAPGIQEFAQQVVAAMAEVPGMPENRLFCVIDDTQGQEFIIAGSGRFAHVQACPVAEFDDTRTKSRLVGGDSEGRGEFWDLQSVTTSGGDMLLLYVESTPAERLRVDKGLQDLLAQHMAATYDHLNAVEQVRRAHRAAVTALSDLAEFKDTETGEHVLRVARMTDEIAWVLRENGHFRERLSDSFLEQVGTAAILHDVGKVVIPDRILLKPGSLDAEERRHMQTHTTQGGAILAKARNLASESLYLALATEIAESHHEHYDGCGYPQGLKGEEIPLAARIVAVVDVFDALSSKRPYKEAWPQEEVLAYIRTGAGSQFDPQVVDAFLTVMDRRAMVGLLEWTPSMSVGEAALDDDHCHLLQLLNQVTTAQVLGNRAIVEYVLDELHFYIQEHFAREERHMEAMAFPGLDAHRKIHRSYSEKIAQIRWQFLRGLRGELSEELLSLLSNWLTEHIMGVDKAYKTFQEQRFQCDPT